MRAHRIPVIISLLASTIAAAATTSEEAHGAKYRLAVRASSVREALAEMLADRSWERERQTDLFLTESHSSPPPGARVSAEDWSDIRVPVGLQGQDLVFQERFIIENREEDFEDASEKWVARKLKGSDAAAAARGRLALSPRFGWDGGPIVGMNRGRFTVMGGEDQLHVKWTHQMLRPGWRARISVGTEDGEDRVAFSIGRSLLRASRPR